MENVEEPESPLHKKPESPLHKKPESPLHKKPESPLHKKPECCIFKVHNQLWEIKAKAYRPQIVAIGPYHQGRSSSSSIGSSSSSKKISSSSSEEEERKVNFSMMEEQKLRYLQKMRDRLGEGIEDFSQTTRNNIARVRNFYAEPLSFSNDELVQMMVMDGCFIIEILLSRNDPIFNIDWILNTLRRDLLLFKNQLPLFILTDLFDMIEHSPGRVSFVDTVTKFFEDILPDPKYRWDPSECQLGQVRHLLELIHLKWHSEIGIDSEKSKHVIDLVSESSRRFIRCARELREAGVEFEKFDEGNSLFDIRFSNGILQIPTLIVDYRTEALLRNLVTYEQYWIQNWEHRPRFVTEYVCFLDRLIDSSKDVEILCRRGIIRSSLGDDEAVADIFNKIGDSVIVANSRYYDVERRVNSHCEKSWNRWLAMLRHNQFNSPWGVLSVAAGFILLILTFTQTIFAIFPRK